MLANKATRPEEKRKGGGRKAAFATFWRYHPEWAAITGCIIVFIGFSLAAPTFITADSLAGIFTVVAELGIIATGLSFLMISGEIDLSVGSVLGMTTWIFAFTSGLGWPYLFCLILALVTAGAMGLVNGLLTIKTHIPSFIATLGMMMFWRGMMLLVTAGFPIYTFEKPLIFRVLNGKFLGELRTSALWFIGIALIANFVLVRTRYGNAAYATGGNAEAARVLGVATDRIKVINFMLTSVLVCFAGCIQFARFGSVDPLRGQGMELEVIAAVVIGGILFTGGAGNIIGTLFGVLLVGMVRSGLVQAGAPSHWYHAFVGLVLVFAVVMNTSFRRWALK